MFSTPSKTTTTRINNTQELNIEKMNEGAKLQCYELLTNEDSSYMASQVSMIDQTVDQDELIDDTASVDLDKQTDQLPVIKSTKQVDLQLPKIVSRLQANCSCNNKWASQAEKSMYAGRSYLKVRMGFKNKAESKCPKHQSNLCKKQVNHQQCGKTNISEKQKEITDITIKDINETNIIANMMQKRRENIQAAQKKSQFVSFLDITSLWENPNGATANSFFRRLQQRHEDQQRTAISDQTIQNNQQSLNNQIDGNQQESHQQETTTNGQSYLEVENKYEESQE